ncbi:hypothetical protein ACFQ1S_13970, partial [Kibdelosporangium lantanae]
MVIRRPGTLLAETTTPAGGGPPCTLELSWYSTRSIYVHSVRTAFGIGRTAKAKLLPVGMFALFTNPGQL